VTRRTIMLRDSVEKEGREGREGHRIVVSATLSHELGVSFSKKRKGKGGGRKRTTEFLADVSLIIV